MKSICPWVNAELPRLLHKHKVIASEKNMKDHEPAHIQGDTAMLVYSFKEVWKPENCHDSIKNTGLYEAGGNLCWIDPGTAEQKMPLEDN